MKILVIAAGKPSLDFAKIGIEEYCKRLSRYAKLELKFVKDGSSDEVSSRLLEASRGLCRQAGKMATKQHQKCSLSHRSRGRTQPATAR